MKMQLVVVALVSLVAACGGSTQQEQAPASVEEALAIGGISCGANVCGAGTYCCNASCGTCAPKGNACLDVMCEVSAQPEAQVEAKQEAPAAISIGSGGPCGTNYCGKGYFCCNPGCGVCAPTGGGCPDVMCD
ncbi:hypothetical protein [Archangium lansingense]|uniref:Uncharacterized protein n=1 Tax=Archangium lansingense TaxID=2995310 RepID=A0ABT3ZX01_9BACT|nr:hypothetical protein [Archangium lansinium]MCY1073252.1 hypothetical protein [Archangium lansinium]